MLFFCTKNLPHDINAIELGKLQDFKAHMRSQGLFQEYDSADEFEHDLYRHLDKKVEEFVSGKLPLPPPPKSAAATKEIKELPADSRLHNPIDFGKTLNAISSGFAAQMDLFDAIDGVHPDKFYDLGSHIYGSVATCLDRFLSSSAARYVAGKSAHVFERLSGQPQSSFPFNNLVPKIRSQSIEADGRELSNQLSAQVAHAQKWNR